MNGRKLKILTAIAAILTLGEFASAVQIGLGRDPWGAGFAVVFGVFFGLGTWLLKSEGDPAAVTAVSQFLLAHREDWLVNEIIQFWKRTVRRT